MKLSTYEYTANSTTVDLTDEIGHEVDLSSYPPPAGEWAFKVKDLGNGRSRLAWLTYDQDPMMWEIPYMCEVVNFDTEEELTAWFERRKCDEDHEVRPGEYEDYYTPEEWTGSDDEDPTFERFAVGYFGDSTIWAPGRNRYCGLSMPSLPLGNEDGFTNPAEALDSILADYQAWARGEVYGVNACEVDNVTGEVDDSTYDAVWGFVGDEYAEQTLTCMSETGDYG